MTGTSFVMSRRSADFFITGDSVYDICLELCEKIYEMPCKKQILMNNLQEAKFLHRICLRYVKAMRHDPYGKKTVFVENSFHSAVSVLGPAASLKTKYCNN